MPIGSSITKIYPRSGGGGGDCGAIKE